MKKVAVVEDEESLRRVIVEWLTIEGYGVAAASTGREGVEVVIRELPDLVLLDIILPELNGLEVMQELKKNPSTSRIPIVVLSNLGDDSQREQACALGAVDYLVKAEHDLPSITRVIERILNNEA